MTETVSRFRLGLERFLEAVSLLLLSSLALLVAAAVVFRKAGLALSWYDEVASILLAWLTYYGAALAALRNAHIGFPGLVDSLGARLRLILLVVREVCIAGFFILLAWAGVQVTAALAGTTLVSLPWVPAQLAHSVIPIGAVLFVLAELLSLPERLAAARTPVEKST